jgi:hypothetical protein
MYPAHWVPHIVLPFWAAVPLLALMGIRSFRWMHSLWNKQGAVVDCSRAKQELGLELIPLEQVRAVPAQVYTVSAQLQR